jgi:prevent-host-death family protein
MRDNVVGARELKTRLGKYLRRVQRGQRLVVTDRGRPVAELRPITAEAGVDAVLAELEAQGVAVRPSRTGLAPFRPIEARGTRLSEAVVSDRDDRF